MRGAVRWMKRARGPRLFTYAHCACAFSKRTQELYSRSKTLKELPTFSFKRNLARVGPRLQKETYNVLESLFGCQDQWSAAITAARLSASACKERLLHVEHVIVAYRIQQ